MWFRLMPNVNAHLFDSPALDAAVRPNRHKSILAHERHSSCMGLKRWPICAKIPYSVRVSCPNRPVTFQSGGPFARVAVSVSGVSGSVITLAYLQGRLPQRA